MQRLFILFLFLAVASVLTAYAGVIEGIVVDEGTGDPLIGVNVRVENTERGASTDLDGRFRVLNVPEGTYSIAVSYIGYTKLRIQNIVVADSLPVTLNLSLKEEALELGEVVIEARQLNNSEAAMLGIRKRAGTVSDGISSEQIKKSPDSDAAEAVKRITGITVVSDKYVFVRGMGERYNNTRLNGSSLASPEPLKRVVPFDIIPANLLDNIIVSKTFSPDQPGDFAGGSLQLSTKEFPEKLTFSASNSVSYNDQTSFEEFRSYRGGDKDWLGMDDGYRAIPDRVLEETLDPLWQTDVALRKELAKEFPNVWEGRPITSPLNGSRNVSLGNRTTLFGRDFGYLGALTYSNSSSRRFEEQYGYTALADQNTAEVVLDTTANLDVDRSSQTVGWGGIFDLNLKLGNDSKVGVKTLYTRSADNEVKEFEGTIDDDTQYKNSRLTWTERSLTTIQPGGTHRVQALRNLQVDWRFAYSRGTFDQPDRRDVYYNYIEEDSQWVFLPTNESGYRRFAEMRDDVYEGGLDFTLPVKLFGDRSSKIKFGGLNRDMKRSFPTRKFYYRYEREIGTQPLDASLPPEVIFDARNIDSYFQLSEITRTLDSYNAEMSVTAGYLMADFSPVDRLRAVLGVRFEDTDQYFKTFPYPGSESVDVSEGGPKHSDVMPSLNLTYRVNDKSNMRLAVSRTISNPDYAEIVPTEDTDYFEGTIKRGNPDIKYTKITNYDLRFETYPSILESFSVGAFYKAIQDPVEWFFAPGVSGGEVLKPDNLVDATNLGVELEARKSFAFLESRIGEWIRYFSASGNFTFVSSNVDLKKDVYNPTDPASEGVLTSSERPLMGQSDYVINGILGFDQPRWGSSARLLFNTFGERISQVGGYGVPDTYEQPFSQLEIVWDQKLGGAWSLKLQARNLLNSKVEYLTGDHVFQAYEVGQTFGAGISYSL